MSNPTSAMLTELILLRAGIAVLAAAIGALIAVSIKKLTHRTLCSLVSFAAGALLAVTMLHIIPESAELVGWLPAAGSTVIGVVIFYLIGKYVYVMCPACSASERDRGYMTLGILLMVTLTIHSTMDGLAITAGAAHMPLTGILVLLAVSYHKVPEGLALASVAMLAGNSKRKAFWTAVLIELTTGLGAFLGLVALRGVSNYTTGVVLGLVGGSFIYVIGFAILSEMWEHEKKSILIYATAGFALIQLTALILETLHIVSH